MSKKYENRNIDKNFFKAMNYEIAGELGILDNEDMKNSRKIKHNNKNMNIDNSENEEHIINPS